MSADNMAIWSQVEMTDPSKTKPFSGAGGFKGTATNATYLARRATEIFGPWGTGWGWTVLEERYVEGHMLDERNRAIVHVIRIRFWYTYGDKAGEAEHFGQTTFVGRNKNGVFTDEEAPKKSLTDAMTKALSLLGFAADIHMGKFDDNKYVNDAREHFAAIAAEADEDKISPSVAYAAQARTIMHTFSNAKALKTWWLNEAQQRTEHGLTNGVREYEALYTDFITLGKTLASNNAFSSKTTVTTGNGRAA